MLKIGAREYKVMLDVRGLVHPSEAVAAFGEELLGVARSLGIKMEGAFEAADRRWIVFLDTLDHAIYRAGMILRQRRPHREGKTDVTLKAMFPDPFIAAGADVRPARTKGSLLKFEEDIGVPFRSRFSNSTTTEIATQDLFDEESTSLADAAAIFPSLRKVMANGRFLDPDSALRPVNNLRAFETVFKGPEVVLGGVKATVALILWTQRRKGRPLVGEYSVRYRVRAGAIQADTARAAFDLFATVQRMDWCRPGSLTKTQYVYRTEANT